MKTYGIQVCDIYNFDEIRFQEDQGWIKSVITQYLERNRSLPFFFWGSLIIFEAISADSYILPLFIILLEKGLMEDWFIYTDLSKS